MVCIRNIFYAKSWYIISCILSSVKFSFFFFSHKLKETKIILCLIKYGNSFHRLYIFSKIISDIYSLLKNKFSSLLVSYFLKFSDKKNRKIFWKILKIRFFDFFFKRPSLNILDFYYQSIFLVKKMNIFLSIIIFPLQFRNSKKKKYFFNYKGSLRAFISGFSTPIRKKIKKFQYYFINFFLNIPFMISSCLGQDIVWEYLRIEKKKKIKNLARKFFEILHYMSPYKTNFFIIVKITTSCEKKKIFNYYYNFNMKNEKNFKKRFIVALFFIILTKNKFRKKNIFFNFFRYENLFVAKQNYFNKNNNCFDFLNIISKFSLKEIFFNFLLMLLKTDKIVLKEKKNRFFFINFICFVIQKMNDSKIFKYIFQNCFLHIKLISIKCATFKQINKILQTRVELFMENETKAREKTEKTLFFLFLNFHEFYIFNSKCKLFFCQLLPKILLNFKKKNKINFFINKISEKVLISLNFYEVYKKKNFFLILKKIKIPLNLGKKNIFNFILKNLFLEMKF